MISIRNVTFSYSGTGQGKIEDINLDIEKGSCVLLCGRSGCGKTTITRLINGLIPYFYEGERLSSVSISVDGELEKRIIYLDTAGGTPAAFSGDITGYLLPSYYVYSLDGDVIRSSGSSGWTPPVSYVLQADGTWKEAAVVDGRAVTKIYSPSGLLLSAEGNGVLEEYRYDDDGTLLSSIDRRGRDSAVTRYDNGAVSSISYYSGTALVRVRSYLDNGDIEEIRYEGSKPRARIIFDSDGLRIKEVHNL